MMHVRRIAAIAVAPGAALLPGTASMISRAALKLVCAFATLAVVTSPFFATPAYAATAPVSGTANCVGLHPLPETVATNVQIKTAKETKSAGVNLLTGGFSLTMSAVPAAGIDGTATITCDGGGTWQLPVYIPPGGTSSLDQPGRRLGARAAGHPETVTPR